jgi:hypothetical protein
MQLVINIIYIYIWTTVFLRSFVYNENLSSDLLDYRNKTQTQATEFFEENMVMSPARLGPQNDYAGEGHQQLCTTYILLSERAPHINNSQSVRQTVEDDEIFAPRDVQGRVGQRSGLCFNTVGHVGTNFADKRWSLGRYYFFFFFFYFYSILSNTHEIM